MCMNKTQQVREILKENPTLGTSDVIKEMISRHGHSVDESCVRKIRRDNFSQTLSENNLPEKWEHGWFKTDNSSIFIRNPEKEIHDDRKMEEFLNSIKKISPKVPKYNYQKPKEKHLLIVDPADIHIGKLSLDEETGDEYNVKIAIERVLNGIRSIIQKSSSYPIEKVVLVIGNDVLHTDTPKRTTTSGTPQDTDGMWFDNYQKAFNMYAQAIALLKSVAPVHIVHCPSNHDWTSGYFLAHALSAYYSNDKNITSDVSINHRKAFLYGKNLIGFTHGDGAKDTELPQLMAQEFRELWGKSERGYWYVHHVHHQKVIKHQDGKDYIGVTVEYLRSVSGTDGWHHKSGYVSPKSMYGFIHDENGQVARLLHNY